MRQYPSASIAMIVAATVFCAGTVAGQPLELPFDYHYLWLAGESVHLSQDGGQSWQEVREGLPETLEVWRIVGISGSQPAAIMTTNQGVFRFADSAWQQCELPEADKMGGLLRVWEAYPRRAEDGNSYMGYLRALYGLGDTYLWRTGDGGQTWSFEPLPEERVWRISGGCDGSREIIYAQANGPVYLRADVGEPWQRRDGGIPEGETYLVTAVVDNPVHAYALAGKRVYATHNGGVRWELACELPEHEWYGPHSAVTIGPLPGTTYIHSDVPNPRYLSYMVRGRGADEWGYFAGDVLAFDLCPFHPEALFYVTTNWNFYMEGEPTRTLFRADALTNGPVTKLGPVPWPAELSVACRLP